MKHKIAIFASGNGSNFEALAAACESGQINAEVVGMVCDKAGAYVIERAANYNVPTFVFSAKDYADKATYEVAIVSWLNEQGAELICLAGYMRIVGDTLLQAFPNRILNIHPALLPSFKGAHAIQDAFAFGVKVFGVTVHLIDNTIDGGTIIAQRAFEYHGNDISEVETQIHTIEHILYPEAVNTILNN